ncbi:MAG: hypothetical protein ACEY3L_08305 [Wolbachia sp.]
MSSKLGYLRHTVTVSHIDPANKQRDDDNVALRHTVTVSRPLTSRGMTAVLRHTAIHSRYLLA